MEIIHSFILGLIQGLTEFLPVSSSGHLVLGEVLLGTDLNSSIMFEVVVHFGTLCSIIIYFKKELADILQSLGKLLAASSGYSNKLSNDDNIKLTGFILLSMIPALVVGLTMKDFIEAEFLNPVSVSIMLLITGLILFLTKFRKSFPNHLNSGSAFGMGLAQAFAILPGISRSGSTISLALYLGIKREEAANFSFLMVIPVIAGAMLLQLIEIIQAGMHVQQLWGLLVGFFTAFISGYFALKYLIKFLRSYGIYPFAWYCWAIGLLGLIYFW